MTDNLTRLHRALVEALRKTRGDDFDQPITVSQIYQELVPYRVARGSVGFEMNADYEFTLLRLLAGDRDLARLEPPEVRTMLRKEVDSPNPNVSLFRAYANCDVWIAPPQDWIAEMVADPNADEPEIEVEFEPEPVADPKLAETAPRPQPAPPPPRFVPESSDELPHPERAEPAAAAPAEAEDEIRLEVPDVVPAAAMPMAGSRPQHCAFCGGNLPGSRLVNFCPHCGNDLTQQPCSNCGETLEANWHFCINCGTPAGGFDAQAN